MMPLRPTWFGRWAQVRRPWSPCLAPSVRSMSVMSREANIAPDDYNRWLVVPPAVLTHLSLGGLYAWSVLNEPLSRTVGVVSAAPADWSLASVIPVFSTAVFAAGATGAFTGKLADRDGPRKSIFTAGALWGGGLMLAGAGVELHSLPLLYAGYGVIGGAGIGFAYSPPVATLLRWFPDKKGMASGMVIMGFGSGALVALPAIKHLMEANFKVPAYYGAAEAVQTIVEGGKRFLASDPSVEVVVATAGDIAKLGLKQIALDPGVYAVGTGSTGVGKTLLIMGAVYGATMIAASFAYKIPSSTWKAPVQNLAATSSASNDSNKPIIKIDPLILPAGAYVAASDAIRSRQFAQIWASLFLNATAGIAVLGVAKTLMSDVFGSSMPSIVDPSFCAAYVGALSLFNGVGRLGWAATSDVLGRQRTFSLFFMLGAPLYLSVPLAAHLLDGTSTVPLAMFTGSTLAIITMYGGSFSVSPAYLADLFGSKEVGNIYGKLLTAWSAAGLLGPTLLAWLRRRSEITAIEDLSSKVDAGAFASQFGVSPERVSELIANNAISISKLMEIAPPGTLDPSPFLYDSSMKVMAALLVLGVVNNALMRPVSASIIKR